MTRLAAVFGDHSDLIEMCELNALRAAVRPAKIKSKIAEFRRVFDVAPDYAALVLQRAARTPVALDRLVAQRGLGALTSYFTRACWATLTSMIADNALLTWRHVPVAGECEIENAPAVKTMDELGAGGSVSEFYLADFENAVVGLGYNGLAHYAIAEGRASLVPLPVYHGKPGRGVSIQMSVRHGPATLRSVVEGPEGAVSLLTAEGASVAGTVLQIGKTNSRYRLAIGREFMQPWSEAGPAHHCAISVGHVAGALRKLVSLAGIHCVRVA